MLINRILKLKQLCPVEDQIAEDTELTLNEARIIQFINNKTQATNHEVADHLNLSPSRCSRIVDRLVSQNFLHRVTTKSDRRCVTLKLTKQGQQKLPAIKLSWEHCELQLASTLTSTQQEEIARGLDLLINTLENPNGKKGL